MSNEDTMATIPTDQLTLRLLQELAARVERLEKAQEPTERSKPPVASGESTDTSKESTSKKDVQDYGSSSAEMSAIPAASRCVTCDKNMTDSCKCVSIPYGYIFHDEVPGAGYRYMPPALSHPIIERLGHIEDRVRALELLSPQFAERLKKVGFAGVPDDGRLSFKNFWAPVNYLDIDKALGCIDKIRSIDGHAFWVLDFDSEGKRIIYGVGSVPSGFSHLYPICGKKLDLMATKRPEVRTSPTLRSKGAWRRLIILAGLAATNLSDIPYIFVSSTFGDMAGTTAHIRSEPSYCRIPSFRDIASGSPLTISYEFHLVWYGLIPPYQSCSSWSSGRLRGNIHRLISKAAFTIQAISDSQTRYWTILLLMPSRSGGEWTEDIESEEAGSYIQNSPLKIILAKLVSMPLKQASQGWETLAHYIDGLIGTGEEIFDLEVHDNLMFDDDLYTRSRGYFWVINCINKAEHLVLGNIQTWIKFRDELLVPSRNELDREDEEIMKQELTDAVRDCEEWSTKLKGTLDQFREQRTKAVALRDGLFSASAVMESRASTRLGENVKLLTYVSIFYLPLAFCTSIWSTTDTFGYHNLVVTMVVVGFVTYMVVFNLNQIVRFWKSNYHRLKSSTIGKMQKDKSEVWSERGDLFYKYKPRNTNEMRKPSEWWIPVYLLRMGLYLGWLRRKDRPTEDNTTTA